MLTRNGAPTRLIASALLVTVLPLAALSWLGLRLLQQDRVLEIERRRDRLENAANLLANALLETAQGTRGKALPPESLSLLLGPHGVIGREGIALTYYPAVEPQPDAPPGIFAAADAAEYSRADPAGAAAQYLSLARSKDPAIRAGALMRLARVLRNQGRTKEALAVYDDLARMGATPVVDSPAELLARKQRIALLDGEGETTAAAQERTSLANALSQGLYTLDRDTFDFYSQGLPIIKQRWPDLARTVEEWWPRWQAQPSGRETWIAGGTAFAVVWLPVQQGTLAMVGRSEVDWNPDRQAAANRRNLLAAGFGLIFVVIAAAGYFMFRAIGRELAVARLQSEFVAQVSHEFRTPLTAIRHFTELLEEGNTAPERLGQYYQVLGKETRRLYTMVESLLDFGRMESGRRVYEMQRTNLSDVALQVAQEFSSTRVQLQLPERGPDVRADRDAVVLALRNLVDNALKYSPACDPVTVVVEEREDAAGISVEDHGAGIPRKEQREILRKFVRGSAARAMAVKGTGLGLAAVDQVVRAHSGRLEVQSGLGQGSRFTIWLPYTGERV